MVGAPKKIMPIDIGATCVVRDDPNGVERRKASHLSKLRILPRRGSPPLPPTLHPIHRRVRQTSAPYLLAPRHEHEQAGISVIEPPCRSNAAGTVNVVVDAEGWFRP